VSAIRDYYRSSGAYQRMLDAQDPTIFEPYVGLFRAHVEPGASVLDVGCGVGTSTRLLRAEGFGAVGTDVSERFLPPAEDRFVVADFESAPQIRSACYAAAGALNVLEHSERPRRFLAEMVRVVRPGGRIIVLSPNLTSPLVGVRILRDLATGSTPYLAVGSRREAVALILVNLARSVRAALGYDGFRCRAPRLDAGISGYDADAVYWTNAAEVRRCLERHGCRIVVYQGSGRTRAARMLARRLPSFAGQIRIVAEKPA
jgi:SAM-dependent methyltransferase